MADTEIRTPIVTPFDEDEAVDADALADLVDHLIEEQGVTGLVPCGTTGEMGSLTDEERREVVETTVDAADGRVPVMAGVGETAVGEVLDHIAAAAEAGADSALVVAPYFGGDAPAEGNEEFFRAIADESELPVYLYNIPPAVGQDIDEDTVAALADHDNVAGIKDSSGDVTYFNSLIRRTPDDFEVYQGWDGAYAPSLAMGADGGVNALTHFFGDVYAEVAEALEDGDVERARERQLGVIDEVFEACREHGFAPATKAVLAERGVIPHGAVRPPQQEVPDDEAAELAEFVADQ